MNAIADVRRRLVEMFDSQGATAAGNLESWLSVNPDPLYAQAIARHLETNNIQLIFDAFWQYLPFGTGGRRGAVGYGTNRVNPTIVAVTIQGHCNYLLKEWKSSGKPPSVVIANDVRVFWDVAGVYSFLPKEENPLLGVSSRDFAVMAAEIYAGNGILVYFPEPDNPDATFTTPELSHAIRALSAVGGINLSASHNHPDDNGIKLYDSSGGQFTPPADETLAEEMLHPGPVRRLDFSSARDNGSITAIPDEVSAEYEKVYRQQYSERCTPPGSTSRIVYTPLSGCGGRTVGRILRSVGFDVATPSDQEADGTFAAIPFLTPNPEVGESSRPARDYADSLGATLVLSSDPDADRIGADVKVGGEWVHLTGNQLASILTYYLMVDPSGPLLQGLVVETLVTTRLVGAIARSRGAEVVDDLLVGFKYIAALLNARERDGVGRHAGLVLAAEESYGVLSTSALRDKDSVSGALYLAHLHQMLSTAGSDLLTYLRNILAEFGGYAETNRSIVLKGVAGARDIARLMESLRDRPLQEIAGQRVIETIDFWETDRWGAFVSNTDRDSRNVLQWRFSDFSLTARPSGTEPKLKLYVHLLPGADEDSRAPDLLERAQARADEIARNAYAEFLRRIDRTLSPAALELPDIIDVAQKKTFDDVIAVGIARLLSNSGIDAPELVDWLRSAAASLIPGADPLPAVLPAVERLCKEWIDEARPPGVRNDRIVWLLKSFRP